jgi:hypothetical protein
MKATRTRVGILVDDRLLAHFEKNVAKGEYNSTIEQALCKFFKLDSRNMLPKTGGNPTYVHAAWKLTYYKYLREVIAEGAIAGDNPRRDEALRRLAIHKHNKLPPVAED